MRRVGVILRHRHAVGEAVLDHGTRCISVFQCDEPFALVTSAALITTAVTGRELWKLDFEHYIVLDHSQKQRRKACIFRER